MVLWIVLLVVLVLVAVALAMWISRRRRGGVVAVKRGPS
jgi:hypothetical protein